MFRPLLSNTAGKRVRATKTTISLIISSQAILSRDLYHTAIPFPPYLLAHIPKAKVPAEEGLLDLVGDAWGSDTLVRAQEHLEEEAVQYHPIDTRAFTLAVEGRLEPGREVKTNYEKAAVEVCVG